MPVEAARVTVGRAERRVNAVGSLRSNSRSSSGPGVGRIVALAFEEGQKVRRGQVLMQLDTSSSGPNWPRRRPARPRPDQRRARRRTGAARRRHQRALDEARATLRTTEASVQLAQADRR
jgi:membrane fusion protein (multidrug efflux system)